MRDRLRRIELSRFWQLRNAFFALKHRLGGFRQMPHGKSLRFRRHMQACSIRWTPTRSGAFVTIRERLMSARRVACRSRSRRSRRSKSSSGASRAARSMRPSHRSKFRHIRFGGCRRRARRRAISSPRLRRETQSRPMRSFTWLRRSRSATTSISSTPTKIPSTKREHARTRILNPIGLRKRCNREIISRSRRLSSRALRSRRWISARIRVGRGLRSSPASIGVRANDRARFTRAVSSQPYERSPRYHGVWIARDAGLGGVARTPIRERNGRTTRSALLCDTVRIA